MYLTSIAIILSGLGILLFPVLGETGSHQESVEQFFTELQGPQNPENEKRIEKLIFSASLADSSISQWRNKAHVASYLIMAIGGIMLIFSLSKKTTEPVAPGQRR